MWMLSDVIIISFTLYFKGMDSCDLNFKRTLTCIVHNIKFHSKQKVTNVLTSIVCPIRVHPSVCAQDNDQDFGPIFNNFIAQQSNASYNYN